MTIAIWADAGGNSLKLESRRETNVRSAIVRSVSRTLSVSSIGRAVASWSKRAGGRLTVTDWLRQRPLDQLPRASESANRNGSVAMTDAAYSSIAPMSE